MRSSGLNPWLAGPDPATRSTGGLTRRSHRLQHPMPEGRGLLQQAGQLLGAGAQHVDQLCCKEGRPAGGSRQSLGLKGKRTERQDAAPLPAQLSAKKLSAKLTTPHCNTFPMQKKSQCNRARRMGPALPPGLGSCRRLPKGPEGPYPQPFLFSQLIPGSELVMN